ncbi:MAG: heavy-metal-associated domain-containing protein [Balneolaceae bacterium]|nr:MAG: heavy-metal-associated domain-containing protein [Balneolaceae bacterium]
MEKTYDIFGMHCAGCVNSVERLLTSVEGVSKASVHLTTEKAVVEFESEESPVDDNVLIEAVSKAGFELVPAPKKKGQEKLNG